jgi:hypothetical protein
VRAVLGACARRLDGKPAAATTTRRKRAVFANTLGYAVERRLPASPLGQIQWKASEVAETVDRRSVASPAQIRRLLKAIRGQGPRGEHMEAFFGCLYYVALRPAEAVALREADCVLPERGWAGSIWPPRSLALAPGGPTTAPAASNAASSTGRPAKPAASPSRPPWLRCSAPTSPATAPAPAGTCSAPPAADRSTTQDGVKSGSARPLALTPAQQASPLARRPYDLRHAAVSLWLNAGVPPTEVARRAGQGVAVLLKVYANCIDGQARAANQRIGDALDEPDSE